MLTKDFIKAIFAGNKSLMKLSAVKMVSVKKYDEISVKALYSKLVGLPNMAQYFPASYCKGRQCDRDYLFNITQSIHPDVMKELLDYAHKHRHDIAGEKQAQEAVLATPEWLQELKSMPYFSKVSTFLSPKFLFRERERWRRSSSRSPRSGWPPSPARATITPMSSRDSSNQTAASDPYFRSKLALTS
jgi:hypothetical protein